jgi:hypothetical protein
VPISPRPPSELATGTHRLHPDPSINFQLDRWIAWTGGRALGDIRRIAPQLTDYETNRRLSLELAHTAYGEGDLLRAAFTCGRPSSSFVVTILTSCR